MSYADDLKEYKSLAKRVNQRLVRLEQKAASGTKSATRYAYAKAQSDIRGFRGETYTRWSENAKGIDWKNIQPIISSMKTFLSMPSSVTAYYGVTNPKSAQSIIYKATGQNISPVDIRRAATLNKTLKTDYSAEQFQKFMETGGLYDKLLSQFGYREAFKYGSIIVNEITERQANLSKRQVKQALENITLSGVDIEDKDAKIKIKRLMNQRGRLGEPN